MREEEEEGPNKRKEQLAKSADSSCGKFDDGTIFFIFLSELNIQRDILHPWIIRSINMSTENLKCFLDYKKIFATNTWPGCVFLF